MTTRNWLITGVSSGFGRELATQLLDRATASSAPSAGRIIQMSSYGGQQPTPSNDFPPGE